MYLVTLPNNTKSKLISKPALTQIFNLFKFTTNMYLNFYIIFFFFMIFDIKKKF